MGDIPAELSQQPGGGQTAVVQAGNVTAMRHQQDAAVSIGFFDVFEPAGKRVQGLIPGYAFKFAVTLWAHSFLGNHQPVRVMDVLPVRPASETGSKLLIWISDVIALHPDNPVVFHMQFDGTSAPAVEGRCCPDDFYITHFFLLTR
jgi:hypothetical protein